LGDLRPGQSEGREAAVLEDVKREEASAVQANDQDAQIKQLADWVQVHLDVFRTTVADVAEIEKGSLTLTARKLENS